MGSEGPRGVPTPLWGAEGCWGDTRDGGLTALSLANFCHPSGMVRVMVQPEVEQMARRSCPTRSSGELLAVVPAGSALRPPPVGTRKMSCCGPKEGIR